MPSRIGETLASLRALGQGAALAELDRVTVRRGRKTILEDVSMSVAPGEIVTLIGPNGAGKTTLVKALLGLVKPTGGRVIRRRGLKVGYVPQRLALDATLPLTVARLMTLTRRHALADVRAALEETSVAHLMHEQVPDLSGGELQRVLLARALLARPDLLVLDEPVQGVDFTGEIALYNRIAAIRDRYGCGVLLVSHDLHLVMAATDRVICLNGHICCAGVPRDVAASPEYTRLFGPPTRGGVAPYVHHHDHRHTVGGDVIDVDACSCGEEHGGQDA